MDTLEIKNDKIKYESNLVQMIILTLLMLITVINFNTQKSIFVIFTFVITIIHINYYLFMVEKKAISIRKIFLIFSLFFLAIAPLIQYQADVVMWSMEPFRDVDYLIMNIIVNLIIGLYNLTYSYITSKSMRKIFHQNKNVKKIKISYNRSLALSILVTMFIVFLYRNDLRYLFLRSDSGILNISQSLSSIISSFIRPIPAIICIILFIDKKTPKLVLYFSILLLLVSNFPLSTPRYYTATLYLPFVIILFNRLGLSKNNTYTYLLIFGLLFVFPILNQSRSIESLKDIKFSIDLEMFRQGHFDSYQMFMRVITDHIVTYGIQLLGVIFFFVPRSLYPNKPYGSGYFIAHKLNFSFDNVSMNYFGEGFINFGFVGIVLFVVLFAYISSKLDSRMYYAKTTTYFKVRYLLLLSLSFFMLRGDLMSSYSFIVSFMIATIFVQIAINKPFLTSFIYKTKVGNNNV